jgi:adenosylcobinamide-GDP ribazoletransferase
MSVVDEARCAVGLLTIVPVGRRPIAAGSERGAALWFPLVGGLLGVVAAAVYGLGEALLGGFYGAALALTVSALLSGALHHDGLADTADGLGCYGPPERALAVMRDGGAGPFAVVTLLVALGVQAAALAVIAAGPASSALVAVVLAAATGRAGFAWCCRRGVAAARPGGLGATVAGSQPPWVAVAWWTALAAAGVVAVPDRPWQGVLAVLLAAAAAVALSAHTRRRFGGMTGDVLGAASEVGVTAALVVLAAG